MPLLLVTSLEALKRALGIKPEDDSEDTFLIEHENRATAWVEKQIGRRFQVPANTKEYVQGSGQRQLILSGNVVGAVTLRERVPGSDWETFDAEDFEARGSRLIRLDGYPWLLNAEYEVSYQHGYATAPGDIQSLVIELVGLARDALADEAGLKSETIGDYSYSIDASAMALKLTDTGRSTLNRWRRVHI